LLSNLLSQARALVVSKRVLRNPCLVVQMGDCILVDISQRLRKLVEIHSVLIGLGEHVTQLGHLQDRLGCLEFREKFVVDFLLLLDYAVSHFYLVLG